MALQIEILSAPKVATNPGKKAGSTYQSLEVAYKNLSFGGKVEGRKIMAFGATANAFTVLATAQPGDVFDIDVVKNAAGFNDWTSAKKSSGGSPASSGAGSNSTNVNTKNSTYNATPKSTYETPEERAKKQIYIVRQSSISSAIDLLAVGAKSAPKREEVVETAKYFESYVFGDGEKVITSEVKSLSPEDIDDDIPL